MRGEDTEESEESEESPSFASEATVGKEEGMKRGIGGCAPIPVILSPPLQAGPKPTEKGEEKDCIFFFSK